MAVPREAVQALTQISRRVQEALDTRAREHGVSPTLARLLDLLGSRSPTISELAELLGLDKSSTSGLADRAQRRGLVRRVPSQLDRRSVRVRLTAEGRELVKQLEGPLERDIAALLEPLPAVELEALTEHLSRILIAPAHR